MDALEHRSVARVRRPQAAFTGVALLAFGCAAHSPHDRTAVSDSLQTRTGHALRPEGGPAIASLPTGVDLADGLDEDEAVAVSLWNNAEFQATLAELGLVRADLVEAGLIKNPIFSLLFPLGPKQLEFTLTWPIETLWQRPKRVAAAKLDVEREASRLVAGGLDLVRDVKVAHAEVLRAEERAVLLAESREIRDGIARITAVRQRVGDLSPLEAASAGVDAAMAETEATRAARAAESARERLRTLLGLGADAPAFVAKAAFSPPASVPEIRGLLEDATGARPEVRAAELAIEAASKRAGLAQAEILTLSALLDANGSGKEGFEMGPGLALELPLFGRNKGRVAHAEAELELASRRYLALRERIALEVRQTRIELVAARDSLAVWQERVLPTFEASLTRVEKAQEAGEASRLEVLAARRSLLDARLQTAEALGAWRKAEASLERGVGRSLAPPASPIARSEARP